tara:strand:- start:15021 stop:15653 length:633 start_codon:yes stop_codon:yes gene_type:complete
MDPLSATISSTFGLLATFLQERRSRKEAKTQTTIVDYIEWLRRREHTEAVSLLESNHQLSEAIQNLLSINHSELLERICQLEETIIQALNRMPEWAVLVSSITNQPKLSEQAIEILQWFNSTGASRAIGFPPGRGGEGLVPMDGIGGVGRYEPKAEDLRLFPDDMKKLVKIGLLTHIPSSGSPKYGITREAINLVKNLPDPPEVNSNNPA